MVVLCSSCSLGHKFQLNPESQLLTSQGTQNSEEITLQNSTAFHALSFFHIKAMRAQG